MKLHPSASYWEQGLNNVVYMTGARDLLHANDLRDICRQLKVKLPMKDVLDVGCGTGRAAQICDGYYGVDITPSCVEYCRNQGLNAELITGPDDLYVRTAEWTLAFSLFTHMGREERRRYLEAFSSKRLLADIIPGDGSGEVAKWTANVEEFVEDLVDAGYLVDNAIDRVGLDFVSHRYFLASRRRTV